MTDTARVPAVLVIYDGECSFCTAYARLIRLREALGPVELLSARSDDPRVGHYEALGYALDEGMLVVSGDAVHAGAHAMQWLALHSPAETPFEKLQHAVFRHRTLARLLYPLLKLGRRAWLMLRGRRLIRSTRETRETRAAD